MPASAFADWIVWEEGGLVAINKPPGVASTGPTLADRESAQGQAIAHFGGQMVWALHQLDAETSGLLLLARKKSLVGVWQERMARPDTVKRYLAVVEGKLPHKAFDLDRPLAEVGQGFERRMRVHPGGKPAQSAFRAIGTCVHEGEVFTVAEVQIRTGRTHQIRAHLEYLGLSLVGEKRYRSAPCSPCRRWPRQALHAWRLEFGEGAASVSGGLVLEAPVAGDLRELAGGLGFGEGVWAG